MRVRLPRASARPLLLALPLLCLGLCLALLLVACAEKKAAKPLNMFAKGMDEETAANYYFLLYQDLQRQGKIQEATLVLEELLQVAPTPDFYKDLANLYWGLSQPEKTRQTLEAGIEKFPEDKGLRFYLANSYLLQRRFDEAVKALDGYLATHPHDQSATQELAAVYVESGQFQKALDFLAAMPRDKRTPAMSYYESKAYSGLKKPRQAAEKLRQALREDPNMLPAWSELAFLYEKQKDYRQAEQAYRHLLELGEDSPELWMRLMRLSLKRKNPEKALELMDKGPKDRGFLFEVMALFLEEGYPDAANIVVDRLSREQPGNPDVLFVRAMLAVETEKDPDKALDLLGQIPKDSKLYDKALAARTQLALDNNRLDLARELIVKGKVLHDDRPEYWLYDSVAWEKAGNGQKAAEALREALKRWPDNTEVLYRLGAVLERQKDRAGALAVMEKILTIDPDHAEALNFVGYSLAEEGRDLDRALDLINRALAASPDNRYFIDSLAWVHFKRGDLDAAWEDIQRSVSQPVVDPAIWEHYGDIALARGDKREAAKGYRQALAMHPSNVEEIQRKLEALR